MSGRYRVVSGSGESLVDELPAVVPWWCDCDSYFTMVNGVMIRTHTSGCRGYSSERCVGCGTSFMVKNTMLNGEGKCPNCVYLDRVGVPTGSTGQDWFDERE